MTIREIRQFTCGGLTTGVYAASVYLFTAGTHSSLSATVKCVATLVCGLATSAYKSRGSLSTANSRPLPSWWVPAQEAPEVDTTLPDIVMSCAVINVILNLIAQLQSFRGEDNQYAAKIPSLSANYTAVVANAAIFVIALGYRCAPISRPSAHEATQDLQQRSLTNPLVDDTDYDGDDEEAAAAPPYRPAGAFGAAVY